MDEGVIPWKASFNKWLWGALDSQDAEKINQHFAAQDQVISKITSTVTILANASISTSEALHDDFVIKVRGLADRINEINGNMTHWSQSVDADLTHLGRMGDRLNVLTSGLVIRTKLGTLTESLEEQRIILKEASQYHKHDWAASNITRSYQDTYYSVSDYEHNCIVG